jgi:16S rRNA processing protein RimM
MKNVDDLFYLGKIIKPFGNKGDLYVFLDVDDPENYENMESVFVMINGKPVPFFIENFRLKQKKSAVIKFLDVDEDFAEMMIGSPLYLPLDNLPKLKGKKFYYHEVKGFTIIDKTFGIVGAVTGILEYPGNPVIEIDRSGKTVLLPLNDEFLIKVDRKMKEILMDVPEGLIELYL